MRYNYFINAANEPVTTCVRRLDHTQSEVIRFQFFFFLFNQNKNFWRIGKMAATMRYNYFI